MIGDSVTELRSSREKSGSGIVMSLLALVLGFPAILVAISNYATAEQNLVAEENRFHPFEDGFLAVCGHLALTGMLPIENYSFSGDSVKFRDQVDLVLKDGYILCSHFAAHDSDVSALVEAQGPESQPWWLENPNLIDSAFDQWIDKNSTKFEPTSNDDCLIVVEDLVNEILYARTVSETESGRVMSVTITRQAYSYMEPDRGHTVFLHAWASNARAECN